MVDISNNKGNPRNQRGEEDSAQSLLRPKKEGKGKVKLIEGVGVVFDAFM